MGCYGSVPEVYELVFVKFSHYKRSVNDSYFRVEKTIIYAPKNQSNIILLWGIYMQTYLD